MTFTAKIRSVLEQPLRADRIETLQINIGYRCNMACSHCHVQAGPGRTEMMDHETVQAVLSVAADDRIRAIDITGGAPELHPEFTHLAASALSLGKHVIVRTNLTVLFESGLEHLLSFYRDNDVEITASLPCYIESNVDHARGANVFVRSIEALRTLNGFGYGTGRKLNLVYNPAGAFLAPSEACLEADYRRELRDRYGIVFSRLFAFSNMPLGRFRDFLLKTDSLDQYLDHLASSFNPETLDGVMCRRILNVDWRGRLYDCDFNHVLNHPVSEPNHDHITGFDYETLSRRIIAVGDHCYGCTAGQGFT